MNFCDPRDLDGFFAPASLAIIGVSRKASSFGGMSFLARFIEANYRGAIYPINPQAAEVMGLVAWPDLASLPERPELVMVSVPALRVPAILEECVRLGIRYIHILSAGFSELGTEEGRRLEETVAEIAREGNLLIMGPNCMGPYCPSSGLTAWGGIPGLDGSVGIISQSGGITQRLTEYLASLGVGVSKAASIGNAAVLDSPDFLEYMALDDRINIIAMYLESVRDGRRLFAGASKVAAKKPIILLKGGRSERGAATVSSHTGSMAGDHRLWQAFFNQAGIIPVRTMNEWVDAILAFSCLSVPRGGGVFIVGGGGGNSVIYSDYCIGAGLDVPALSGTSMKKMSSFMPAAGSIVGNPLDLWETFNNTDRLIEILDIACNDPAVHMIIVDRLIPRTAFHSPPIPDPTPRLADFVASRGQGKPIVCVIDYDGGDLLLNAQGSALRNNLCRAGIPAFPSLERAVSALVARSRSGFFDKSRFDY